MFAVGYYALTIRETWDLDCETCKEDRDLFQYKSDPESRGFPFPTFEDGNNGEGCPKALLYGCPVAETPPRFPRLPATIEAYNFFREGHLWRAGGVEDQPDWYRLQMMAMLNATTQEQNRKEEERRKAAEKKTKAARRGNL